MAVGASCRTMIQTTFNELYAINTHVPFVRHLVVDWKICKLCSFFRYSRLECQLNLLVFIFNHVSFPFTRIALDHLMNVCQISQLAWKHKKKFEAQGLWRRCPDRKGISNHFLLDSCTWNTLSLHSLFIPTLIRMNLIQMKKYHKD